MLKPVIMIVFGCVIPIFICISGYGHIAPKTISGQMFCIVYSLLGIPILLVFMAKIGDALADLSRWTYRFVLKGSFINDVTPSRGVVKDFVM